MRTKTIALLSIIATLGGIILYGVLNNIIIIRIPHQQQKHTLKRTTKQHIELHFWQHGIHKIEQRVVPYYTDDLENLHKSITSYWDLLAEEQIIATKPTVQAVTADIHGKTVICSLGQNPFLVKQPAYTNWLIMEGLCATIRSNAPRYSNLWILINHTPTLHQSINIHNPWPLEGFEQLIYKGDQQPTEHYQPPATIIIDPAGDARTPGRTIYDSFERSITLQVAEYIRSYHTNASAHNSTKLTRTVGDIRDQYQRATFANNSDAGLYLHISAYETEEDHPQCMIYTYRTHPTTDLWKRDSHSMVFAPYSEAHLNTCTQSSSIAQQIYTNLSNMRPCPVTMVVCASFPYTPLLGITIPAVAVEIGIPKKYDLKTVAQAIARAISE